MKCKQRDWHGQVHVWDGATLHREEESRERRQERWWCDNGGGGEKTLRGLHGKSIETTDALQVLDRGAGKVGCRWMEERGAVWERGREREGERKREGAGAGILKMQQWGAGRGFTVIRWQNGGGLEMRERGHTQCHCRRVICKCQSPACQGKSERERGKWEGDEGGREGGGNEEGVQAEIEGVRLNMRVLASWQRGRKKEAFWGGRKGKIRTGRKNTNLKIEQCETQPEDKENNWKLWFGGGLVFFISKNLVKKWWYHSVCRYTLFSVMHYSKNRVYTQIQSNPKTMQGVTFSLQGLEN